jgi:hypothetical protein
MNDIIDDIINAFVACRMLLEYFEETEESVASLQWDGYDAEGGSVQLTWGVNGLGRNGVFGSYTSNSGQVYDLSSNAEDWLENFAQYLPQIAKGRELQF